jgi:hypothetical protein
VTNAAVQPSLSVPAWSEYTIAPGTQWFDAAAGKMTRYNIKGLSKIAGLSTGQKLNGPP